MGQYYYIVNTEKKEYINAHNLGGGLKLWEIMVNPISGLYTYLTAESSGSGGGDPRFSTEHMGRWSNNRIVTVGDYNDSGPNAGLFQEVEDNPEYEEISSQSLVDEYNKFYGEDVLEYRPV